MDLWVSVNSWSMCFLLENRFLWDKTAVYEPGITFLGYFWSPEWIKERQQYHLVENTAMHKLFWPAESLSAVWKKSPWIHCVHDSDINLISYWGLIKDLD